MCKISSWGCFLQWNIKGKVALSQQFILQCHQCHLEGFFLFKVNYFTLFMCILAKILTQPHKYHKKFQIYCASISIDELLLPARVGVYNSNLRYFKQKVSIRNDKCISAKPVKASSYFLFIISSLLFPLFIP